jgi:hypothetical protein
MKEKIYEFNIEHPLTAPRRKVLDHFLKKNASKLKWAAHHAWDEENDHLLHIVTGPVKWEIWFAAPRVTVFGRGPFWAKMLFSDKKRAQLREGILYVLQETGFMKAKATAKKAKASWHVASQS